MKALPLQALLTTALVLGGCQPREDGDNGEDAETLVQQVTGRGTVATPTPGHSESPVASIIREDARDDALEVAVQSLQVVVPFGDTGDGLDEGAERMLASILESPALAEGWLVIVRGHSDSSGSDRANLRASETRAKAVAAWLVENGVEEERIQVIAMGEQNPVAPNARPDGTPNEAGRAKNRRVEVVIAPPRKPEVQPPEEGLSQSSSRPTSATDDGA